MTVSAWLKKTQSGSSRMSRWVWVVGLFLLIIIGGAIGLGYWESRNSNKPPTAPEALGGSADDGASIIVTTSTSSSSIVPSGSPLVTPTLTVQKRAAFPTDLPSLAEDDDSLVFAGTAYRHRRLIKRLNV